jgi:uncharacterized phiE125 gp8 family phage protein
MSLTLTAPPAVEPVSLGEAKAFLRVAHTDENQLITDLVRASRERVEALTGLALITQSWRETLDAWPARRVSACGQAVRLLRRPLISVEALRIHDRGGFAQLIDPAEYRVEAGEPGRLIATLPFTLPPPQRLAGGIEIDFTAGFGSSTNDVPAALSVAILQLTAASYGGTERAESARRAEEGVPDAVHALLSPWRRVSL